MSHVRFIHTGTEALGIEYLSAVLKGAGHTTDLVFDADNVFGFQFNLLKKAFKYNERLKKAIMQGGPDILAFSVTCDNIDWAYATAEKIKKDTHLPVVFGGVQATLIPEVIIAKPFVDFVITGEGEFALLELVESLKNKTPFKDIKNLWFKDNGSYRGNQLRELVDDLDRLPFPDKTLFPKMPLRFYPLITGRGCPYLCTYCCAPVLRKMYQGNGRPVRRRSPENVIAELVFAKEKYDFNMVIFEDDLFVYDKSWLKTFAELYREKINLPCQACAHPNLIDEEMISLLKRIRCRAVEIGVQSLNETIRTEVLRRYYSNSHLKEVLALLKKNTICCEVDNIIGLPGESENDILDMLKFYNELRPGKIEIFYLNYFPRLEIIKKSNLAPEQAEMINKGELFSTHVIDSGRNITGLNLRRVNRIILAMTLIYIVPRRIVELVIKKKWYRLLPPINFKACYYANILFFYAGAILNKPFRGHFTRFNEYYKLKVVALSFLNLKKSKNK